MDVKIVDLPETHVAVLQHRNSPTLVNQSVAQFIEWRKSSGLSPVHSSKTFGVIYNDPKSVAPEEFSFDICGEITETVPSNEFGVINGTIAGGRYAVTRHVGSTDRIEATVMSLYRDWLPESGEELRDDPLVFHYLTPIPEGKEHEPQTDVYLPLK